MSSRLRSAILAAMLVVALASVASGWQLAPARFLWPWPDSRLSFIFLSSILGASVGAAGWAWWRQDVSALKGVLLDGAVATAGLAATFLVVGVRDGNGKALSLGAAGVVATAAFLYLLLRFWPLPFVDRRPTPWLLRWSFGGFTLALLLSSAELFLRAPHIFPWPLEPQSSVAFGWVFLGSAAFYGYATLRPGLSNAYPQMSAFLVYDLILIVPFLRHFSTVAPGHRLSLVLYTAALVYSGLLMLYYLALDPATRIWRQVRAIQPAS